MAVELAGPTRGQPWSMQIASVTDDAGQPVPLASAVLTLREGESDRAVLVRTIAGAVIGSTASFAMTPTETALLSTALDLYCDLWITDAATSTPTQILPPAAFPVSERITIL